MSENFDFMWGLLPAIMRKETTKKYYESITPIFDKFDDYLETFSKIHIIDFANGSDLERVGEYLNIPRGNMTDERYRLKLKVYFYTYYFVPNLNNMLHLIQNIMGYFPDNVQEGWSLPSDAESGTLKIDIVIPPEGDDDLLIDFDRIFSAGCRLDWNKIQEAYKSIHSTNNLFGTDVSRPYDYIEKFRIGSTPGTKSNWSTGTKETGDSTPYNNFYQ